MSKQLKTYVSGHYEEELWGEEIIGKGSKMNHIQDVTVCLCVDGGSH